MTNHSKSSAIVQKVWQYAHVLKDDGLAFMDYTEQITYLLFMKMAWERRDLGAVGIPARYTWNTIRQISDDAKRLERYHQALRKLSEFEGLIGLIYTKPQSKISDPAKLRLLMDMIDQEDWSSLDVDVKGEVYEGLLARNADDVRGGAGQYFTPRPVVRAIVDVMRPKSMMTVADPACGSGGFLLAAYEYLSRGIETPEQLTHLRTRALEGVDLVPNVARLCAMNLFLHGLGGDLNHPPIRVGDSLETPSHKVDMVLTNPPFGKKSSYTIVGRDGKRITDTLSYTRHDFWATTSNKQLNFIQHVYSMLNAGGKAAMVVPDNVLFEAGAGETIRRSLLNECDLHTILRLPTGIWYSPSVKANVIFFDKGNGKKSPSTAQVWIYDLRTQQNFSLKTNPISFADMQDFIACFCAGDRSKRRETSLFRAFALEDLLARDKANLDIQWQYETEVRKRQDPNGIIAEILEELEIAMREFASIRKL